MIQIDKNIPIPKGRSSYARYPWRELQVGDSFFVLNKVAAGISGYFAPLRRKYGLRFTSRSVDGGVRIWRVE